MRRIFACALHILAATAASADQLPAWKPESADLLFTSGRDGNGEIYLLPAGGKQPVNLSNHKAGDNWPVWSPDGNRIVFQSNRTGNLDIWVMNADGSGQVQLTTSSEPDYLPAWSPDGRSILFTSWRKESGEEIRAPHIYVMNADGSGQRRLIEESTNTSEGGVWSPDGKWIVFSRKPADKGADIFIAGRDGKNERRITNDHEKDIYNGAPSFSPDGRWIAFYSDDTKSASLAVIDVEGKERRTLLATGQNWYPRWSPDSQWLIYTAAVSSGDEGNTDVFAVPVSGQSPPVLLAGGAKRDLEGSWRPLAAKPAMPAIRAVPAMREMPSETEIQRILTERAGPEAGLGIVAGVVGPEGRKVVSSGRFDGDTVFEIGSVTKVFTSLVLAGMVERGEVTLDDPVAKHLPAGVRIPERNGRSITLRDLAAHTSGLPFMPEGAWNDSTTRYSSAQLYQFLAGYQLQRETGAGHEYSNLGYWLLGEALASKAGMAYESLVRTRILQPLQLKSTAVTLSPELAARLAGGHDAGLQPAPSFSSVPVFAAMPAAGGLVSTVNDLLTLLVQPGVEQALAWTVEGEGDEALIVHDGGTLGYASSVAWDPKQRIGAVVLSNQVAGVGDIARHLLRPGTPLAKPASTKRSEIALETKILDTYVGRYRAEGEGVFVIVREGDFLTIQAPEEWGLPKLRLRPESPQDFFTTELPLRVTFQKDSGGPVTGMVIYPPRGQKGVPAQRSN